MEGGFQNLGFYGFVCFTEAAAIQGRVTELGVICPSLNTTFEPKRVNYERIYLLSKSLGVLHMLVRI